MEDGIRETYHETTQTSKPTAKVLKLPNRTAGDSLDLEERAFEFLRAAYEAAGGLEAESVEMRPLARRLGLDRRAAENLTLRLQTFGLLRVLSMSNGLLRLTPEGVRAIEEVGSSPPEPESRSGSGFADVQADADAGARTPPGLDRAARRELEELFGPLKEALAEALSRHDLDDALDGEQRSELAAEIHTIEAQLESPRPKRRIVVPALQSIESIVGSETEGAAIERISRPIEAFLSDEAGRAARETVRESDWAAGPPDRADQRGAGDGAREPSTRGASQAGQGVAERAGGFAGSGGTFGEITDEADRRVWRGVDESGSVVKTILNEDGEIVAEDVVGDVADHADLLMEGYVDEEGDIVSRKREEPEDDSETDDSETDDSETQPGEDESPHEPRIHPGAEETGETSQQTRQPGGEQRQAEGRGSRDLGRRDRRQTVDSVRDFQDGPMEQSEGRLQSDRAQQESLAGRGQEMIAAYSAVKDPLDEAAWEPGATDAVSQTTQQSREAADERQTAQQGQTAQGQSEQGQSEQAEQDAPQTRQTADEPGEVIGDASGGSGNPAEEDAAGVAEDATRQANRGQREAQEPNTTEQKEDEGVEVASSRNGEPRYAPVRRTKNVGGEETPESPGEDESREYRDDTPPEREYDGYVAGRNEQSAGDEPDVPVLNADEINLALDKLKAHVSLRTELADPVRINVKVDAYLDNVKLEINGVEAQVLLKAKLDRILDTFDRAIEVIDRNPRVFETAARGASGGAEEPGEGVGPAVEDLAPGSQLLGESINDADQSTRRSVDESGDVVEATLNEAGEVLEEEIATNVADLPAEEEYVDDEGRIVSRARDESGKLVECLLDEEGNFLGGFRVVGEG